MGIFNIKPSYRKILADLLSNKIRSILVVVSIAVGVFAVGMIAGAYYIIPNDMNSSYAASNPANIDLNTDPFNKDMLTAIDNTHGVQQAQGLQTVAVRLNTGPDQWTSLDLIALSDFAPQRINAQLHLSGAEIPAKDQVILEKKIADKYNIKTGDELQIKLNDGTDRVLPVAGISQDVTSGIGRSSSDTKGYIIPDTLEWLHSTEYYTEMQITVKDHPNDQTTIQQVLNRVTDKLKNNNSKVYSSRVELRNTHPMDSILQAILRILLILGVLIVFLGGSLISNTLSALLTQHLPQIGIMKLVGAGRLKIVFMYLALIFSFGIMALAIALPLGGWAAYALSSYAGQLIGFPLKGFRFIPQAILAQIVIALAVPLLAGLLPVLKGARVTVQKAITGNNTSGNGPLKKGLLDQILSLLHGISRPVLVSIRNTFRHKWRLALTLFTLTLGGAIFISVFNVQQSLNLKTDQIIKYSGADVNLDFIYSYPVDEIQNLGMQVPGVQKIEAWTSAQGSILKPDGTIGDDVALIAPPANSSLVSPIMLSGRWIIPGDQNAITINEAFLRKFPELKVGDFLRLKVGTHKQDWQIVGIFQFTGVDTLIAYTNYDYLSQMLNQSGRTTMYRVQGINHSLASQTDLAKTLDTIYRANDFNVANSEAGGAFTKSLTDYLGILTGFLLIMAMLTAVVGSVGLAGTLSMSVMERTREIGVLRAIGAHDGVILKLILIEGLLIGLISFVLGSLLSFPITSVLSEVISQAIFNSPANFALTFHGFGIWLAAVAVLSLLASLVPARSASQMTIREVLAYE
ncbi:MAG TPA: FtsX-like permease family protein [Anaerolineaceae bacterium]|nr:FtsX-like permease family protein [Anaerolineaceae bacterium]